MMREPKGEYNPDAQLPEWLEGRETYADGRGMYVLILNGSCSCGNRERLLAPRWKVAAEYGGGYMTDDCMSCLGTMEYSEAWERVDHVVSSYSELKPSDTRPAPGENE